jgi:hypothetical protein
MYSVRLDTPNFPLHYTGRDIPDIIQLVSVANHIDVPGREDEKHPKGIDVQRPFGHYRAR